MHFCHSLVGVEIAVALVNTGIGEEELKGVAELREFAQEHLLFGTPVSDADLVPVYRVRDELRRVLTTTDVEEAASVLNALARNTPAHPRMRRHDGLYWHVDWQNEGATLAEHILAQTVVGLMMYLSNAGYRRIRVCGRDDCERLFVDTTRNRSKRFCDGRNCGGRTHAQNFRERHRRASRRDAQQ